MCFQLYPDCKIVKGKVRDAVYDLTRNSIYIIPHKLSECISDDNIVHFGKLPTDERQAFLNFLSDNELGRFNMPEEVLPIYDEFINPSRISNAIIDIGKDNLPLQKISIELSELVCESVFLRFIYKVPFEYILASSKYFISQSMSSIEIGIQYEDGVEEDIGSLIRDIPLCTRIIIVNSPFIKTDTSAYGISIRYINKDYTCCDSHKYDFSVFSNANLGLYLESQKFNNCLNRKIAIDQYGNIKNCPGFANTFGNVNDISLSEVVENHEFRKFWNKNIDVVEKCRDCELRYACQHCVFDKNGCSYNVYND